VSTPTASAVKTQNDALGRLTTITDSGGGTTSYTYIKNDVLQSVGPTPQTFQKQFQYNGMGQLTSVCEVNSIAGSGACGQTNGENGYLTDYSYDPLGNLLSVTEGVQKRTYAHDGLSRLTSETNPESGKTQYFWDAAPSVCGSGGWSTPGDLGAKENNAGVYNCYGYDGLHRLLGVGNGGASGNCKGFYYDSANGTPPAGITLQNTKGRLVEAYTNSACNGTASLVTDEWFSYDANGRNTDLDQSTPNSGGYYHTTVSYWANNTVASLTGVPGLSSWSFTPDGEGRPYSATYNSASPLDWVTSTTYYPSNGSNPPQNIVTYGDSDTDVSSFDSTTGRMNGFQFNVGSPATTLTGTLGWSANWTLGSMAITDGFTAANSQNCGYGYDALSRISSVGCINTAGTNVWGQDFTFDAFGNLSKSVPSGDTGTSFLPTYSSLTNQYTISGCTITYDANGNPTQDCNNTYTWNVYGNPVTIGSKTLTYDAFGREAEIGSGSTYTQVLYSPIGKLGLMNGQTPKTTRYPLPGGGTAEIQGTGGTKDILHGDWLGSARLSTLYTDQTVVNDTAYSPFGETYDNTASSNLDFTGHFQDTQSGLYDFLNREYSTVGRWISPDPAGLNAVDITNPQSWNRYAYALNNPMSYIDPTGLECVWDDGSYDSSGDPDTGDVYSCGAQGGTWVEMGQNGGWSGQADAANAALVSSIQNGQIGSVNIIGADGQQYSTFYNSSGQTVETITPSGTTFFGQSSGLTFQLGAANNGQNSPPGVPKPPNPILQNCGGSTSPPPTGTEQDLEGLAALSHVGDMAGVTMLGAGLMVGSPIAAGAACFYSGGLMCFAALEAAPAGTVGGYYLMKSGAQQLVALLPSKNGC
jgi:RHS repeat-associated protein